jgi:hypothetical protein
MTREKLVRYVAAAVITLGVGRGVAIAQGQPAAPPPADPGAAPPAAPAAPPGAPGPAEANAGLSRQVNLPPDQQVSQAQADMAKMEGLRDQVRRQLASAREERDVVKTLCLNDKLTQLNVAIATAQERTDALSAAAKRNDTDLSTHEFTILTVIRQRADQLAAEANQCIGEEAGYVGQSSVSTTVDKDLPGDDPTVYKPIDVPVDPPECASCFI